MIEIERNYKITLDEPPKYIEGLDKLIGKLNKQLEEHK